MWRNLGPNMRDQPVKSLSFTQKFMRHVLFSCPLRSSKCITQTQCTKIRSFSFRSEIQALLSPTVELEKPLPGNLKSRKVRLDTAVSSFSKQCQDIHVSEADLKTSYDELIRKFAIDPRALCHTTTKLYMIRLVKSRKFDAVVDLLLEFDLDGACSLVSSTLCDVGRRSKAKELGTLLWLLRELRNRKQENLGQQMLGMYPLQARRAVLGLISLHESSSKLSALHELETFQVQCSKLYFAFADEGPITQGGNSLLDSASVSIVTDLLIRCKHFAACEVLLRHNWHAHDSVLQLMNHQAYPAPRAIQFFISLLSEPISYLSETSVMNSSVASLAGKEPFLSKYSSHPELWRAAINRSTTREQVIALRTQFDPSLSSSTKFSQVIFDLCQASLGFDDMSIMEDSRILVNLTTSQFACFLFKLLELRMPSSNLTDRWSYLIPSQNTLVKILATSRRGQESPSQPIHGPLVEFWDTFLTLIKDKTKGKFQNYDGASLLTALRVLDYALQETGNGTSSPTPQKLSSELIYRTTQLFFHRPSSDVLAYFELPSTSMKSIKALLNHNLQVLRLKNYTLQTNESDLSAKRIPHSMGNNVFVEDLITSAEERSTQYHKANFVQRYPSIGDQFYCETVKTIQRTTSRSSGQIQEIYELLIRNLVQIQPPTICIEMIKALYPTLIPSALLQRYVLQTLTRGGQYSLIIHLLRFGPSRVNLQRSDLEILGVKLFQEGRIHIAFQIISIMRHLYSWPPTKRFLQESVLAIGKTRSSDVSATRGLKAQLRLIKLAFTQRFRMDRMFLSGLLRTVLIKQGLSTSRERLAWLIRKTRNLQDTNMTLEYKEVVDEIFEVLRSWALEVTRSQHKDYVPRYGGSNPRPEKLVDLIDRLGEREVLSETEN